MCKESNSCSCGTSSTSACGNSGFVTPTGPKGDIGLSAYQEWIALGNTGTTAEFLATLVGAKGDEGDQGIQGLPGADAVITPLVWTNLVLENGWSQRNSTPQYSIDQFGFLHLRGDLNGTDKTGDTFANLSAILVLNTKESFSLCASNSLDADNSFQTGLLTLKASGALELLILEYLGGPWLLTSVNPFFIGD